MTLGQFQQLRDWHLRHWHEQPIEKQVWDAVLTLWMIGWAGAPAALLVQRPSLALACAALFFLPEVYVALRRRLHRRAWLRCDWLATLR